MSEHNPSISVSTDGNNNVTLTIWLDIINDDAVRVTLSPGRAAVLLRDLASQTTYAMAAAAVSVARGDCGTCGNTRMIKVPVPGGRESNDHCPDCQAQTRDSFPLVPQIGGGLT